MIEFGSDFHRCEADFINTVAAGEHVSLTDIYQKSQLFASGRHAIEAIIRQEGWSRIWLPAYFCYEVVDAIKATGIEVVFYGDTPINDNDSYVVQNLPYKSGDVLLRMNYFGLRCKRDSTNIQVPVIEDHSHDLISDWAVSSNADWCIASIRKIMPTAAGGILWSPKGHKLPTAIKTTDDCEAMAAMRYEAMQMKHDYLRGRAINKDVFRAKYIETEESIGTLQLSAIDKISGEIAYGMNICMWSDVKTSNWHLANKLLKDKFDILKPKGVGYWNSPFSLVIVCDNQIERDALKMHLINNKIYPAVLWQIPKECEFKDAIDFSHRMLSIHCDGRYSRTDIEQMCKVIAQFKL